MKRHNDFSEQACRTPTNNSPRTASPPRSCFGAGYQAIGLDHFAEARRSAGAAAAGRAAASQLPGLCHQRHARPHRLPTLRPSVPCPTATSGICARHGRVLGRRLAAGKLATPCAARASSDRRGSASPRYHRMSDVRSGGRWPKCPQRVGRRRSLHSRIPCCRWPCQGRPCRTQRPQDCRLRSARAFVRTVCLPFIRPMPGAGRGALLARIIMMPAAPQTRRDVSDPGPNLPCKLAQLIQDQGVDRQPLVSLSPNDTNFAHLRGKHHRSSKKIGSTTFETPDLERTVRLLHANSCHAHRQG